MGSGNDGQGWTMGDGMGWGGWLMMSILIVMCLAFVGGLLYVLLRGSQFGATHDVGNRAVDPNRSVAERTLDERFARGEIDQPEYHQRKGALRTG